MTEPTTQAPAQDAAQEGAQETPSAQAPAQRAAALHTNAQGKGDRAHQRTQYVPVNEVEANRKAARRPAREAAQPAAYEPHIW
ncbi:hypothetical protein I5H06_gp05 [Mycobacterium phage SirPhilip]|uniref:Uncharacterized protein n=1 Tax=Mycobacterium phage SirPhilip TaxID=2015824 RepID=A0A222ZLQ5_9CAUD|nr:hypothetical protein I5H06_gp05 [Mycobacterium phage SirPhilip]ASR85299.1 hypothetical protein SEA_SIRPHILIP_97 [Mycobacterium phage SirPhilip]